MMPTASVGKNSNASATSPGKTPARRPATGAYVVCIDNSEYPASLELHKIYRVIPDREARRDGDLRIVDESGEDYLYPAEWFATVKLSPRIRGSLLQAR